MVMGIKGWRTRLSSIFYAVFAGRGLYDFYVAELPQVHGTSILGRNLNCLYAGVRDITRAAGVLGEAANHYTSGTDFWISY